MKKLLTFILFFIPVFAFSQNKDTIFMKTEQIVPCTINKIKNNIMYCTRVYDENRAIQGTIKLIDVEKYIVDKNSIIEVNIKYNPNIPTLDTTNTIIEKKKDAQLIKSDTINIQQINDSYSKQINELNKKIDAIRLDNQTSGKYLKNAGRNSLIGWGLNILGGGLCVMGAYLSAQTNIKPNGTIIPKYENLSGLYIAGGIIMAGGLGFSISVPIYIGKAGRVY